MEKLEVDSKSGSDEEFFDCIGKFCTLAFEYENDCKLISNFCSFVFFFLLKKKNVKTNLVLT